MVSDRPRKKKFYHSKLFIVGLMTVFLLVIFAYGRAYYQDYEVRQEIARLQDEVRNLETKKIESLELLKYVQSPAFAEEKARLELNLVKPGEKVAIVSKEKTENLSSGQVYKNVVELDNTSNIIKWWRCFMGGER